MKKKMNFISSIAETTKSTKSFTLRNFVVSIGFDLLVCGYLFAVILELFYS